MIEGCLGSLQNQTADFNEFEIVVVDNNSPDCSYQKVLKFSNLPNLIIIKEHNQGLSFARNRGILEAKGEYIAFLDDDARAHKDYIKQANYLINQADRIIDCLGGPILPFYTSSKPSWFDDKYEIRRMWPVARYLTKGQNFSGSNMIWRKSVLTSLGGFDTNFGMKGHQLILGEETLLFDKIWIYGNPSLYYSPDLIIYHWVPEYKMRVKYRLQRAKATGKYQGMEVVVNNKLLGKEIIKSFSLLIILGAKALLKLLIYKKWENWVVETLSPMIIELVKLITIIFRDSNNAP